MSTKETPIREPSPDAQRAGGPGMLEPDGLGPSPAPPGPRRGRRSVGGVAAAGVGGLGGAGWWAGAPPGLDTTPPPATPAAPTATATVARQDLNGQTKVSG